MLLGGGEWQEPCRDLDQALLALSGSDEVLVLPAAAAFEHPARVVERATSWFESLGARVAGLEVVNRRDAEEDAIARRARDARFIYVADGSPLHLRSVLKSRQIPGPFEGSRFVADWHQEQPANTAVRFKCISFLNGCATLRGESGSRPHSLFRPLFCFQGASSAP